MYISLLKGWENVLFELGSERVKSRGVQICWDTGTMFCYSLCLSLCDCGQLCSSCLVVDGTFCQAALKAKIYIKEQLPKYLDTSVQLGILFLRK